MKTVRIALAVMLIGLGAEAARAQFDSGSDGSFGPINLAPFSGLTAIQLPPDGVIKATTVTVNVGSQLVFAKNALNTPVILLCQGDVILDGGNATIDVGANGNFGGPGGFDGGHMGTLDGTIPPGAGLGPGAGLPGTNSGNPDQAGGGSYGIKGTGLQSSDVYGGPLLIPLVGGSGGGASPAANGGGGGGALLIASNTKIRMSNGGGVFARGSFAGGSANNGGSGGAVRLIAPVMEGIVVGIEGSFGSGRGRTRLDLLDRTNLQFNLGPQDGTWSIGSLMMVAPPVIPKLDIISAAGTVIPVGSGPVFVSLPFGSPSSQNIVVRGLDFQGLINIDVVVTPENGTRAVFPAQIDMGTGNPAQVIVPVQIPANTTVSINAFTH